MAQGVGSCRVSKGVSTLPHGRLRGAFFVLVTGLSLLRLNSLGVSGPEKLFKTGYASTGASFIRPARRPLLLGRELPEPLRRVLLDKPAQGSGPDPDKQLTPTAQNSQEFDVATPGLDKVARIAFVSNGVDEWVNSAEPGPNDPPPPEDDPNHHPDGQIDRYGVSDTGFNIWLMRHDGSAQYALTDMPGDERDPAYDPGGTILAFVNNQTGTYQIYTIDILNKTIRQITSDPGNKSSPTWSADGTMIAYATDINGPSNRDILRVRTTGVGTPVVLVATPSDEFEPMWSPNGNWILFTRNDGGITHIWRMDAWGASQEQLTNGGGDPTASDKNPAWRQDGLATEFAFASNRLTDISDAQKDYNIWTLGASGEIAGATPVLHSNTDPTDTKDDIMPAFSPLLAPVPSAAPVRIFFTSYRMDKIGPPEGTAEPDIWGLVVDDARPPVLLELPTVSNRNLNPGDDIIVYARPYDDETGVQTVVAWFKDPDSMDDDAQGLDHKFGGPPVTPTGNKNYEGSTTCPGPYFAEREFDRVGSVQLLDDGDLANSGDQVAGDGIYSGIWTTPSIPSDFIIDIELTDNSGNFINFDDVYGFSTVRFAPRANVLFVNDYCEGQEFLAQAGLNNEDFAGYSVESYFTHNESNGGPGAYYNTLNGPYNESYDLWRVICRGAPDLQTLSYYGPSAELQLTPDLEDFREVPVANRCVFWAAPHTGDVWAADGTIVEAATQALLTNFVERGGRLAVAGMDIAWALTMDGQVANSFLTNVLGANFVRDDDGTANRNRDFTASIEWQLEGIGGDPVADDTWTQGPTDHWTDDTTDDMCSDIVQNNVSTDGASFSPYPDVIAPAGSVVVYNYTGPGSGVAAVRREDPASLARVVYFAFPFEALHRRYDSGSGCACRNKRSKLMHMTLCYLRTGGFQGRVVDRDGLRPIRDPEPIVTVQDYDNETILYAQRCQKDGRYVIGGLPPNWYVLKATRPGYKIDKLNRGVCHGGLSYPVQDFVITQAQPGAIQGTVTSLATGEPIANVTITAVSATDPLGAKPIPPVVTAADGTYVLPNLPVDDYTVTADGSTATPPYGSDTADVTVVPGGTVTQDFQLPAAPGTLLVTVKDSDTNALLADVTVEAVLNNVVVGSGLTNTSGQASLDLPPGTYNLIAEKPGYARATASATVLSAQTTPVEIKMNPLPPGSIAGQIYRASATGEALGGVTVRVIVGSSIIAQVTSDDEWTYPGGGNPRYNYIVPSVPAGGKVEVQALKPGFTVTPSSRTVQVSSGAVTYNVNFAVSALHTFPAGLQFISVPFDYSDESPPAVLGTPAGQTLKMAAYDVSLGRYAVYPAAPADRLRLGMAYWLKLPQAQDLVSEGRHATSPYLIPLGVGWNGIGNPFTKSIDFYSLRVRDSSGVVRSIQEAFSTGQVRNALYAYNGFGGGYLNVTTLIPYSGYWVYASQAVTLVVPDPSAGVTAADTATEKRPALAQPSHGWLAPIEVWSAGMCDASCAFGVTSEAAVTSVPKPPLPPGTQYVYAVFESEDGPRAIDARTTGNQLWRLTVHATNTQAPVTVTWPDLSRLPQTARPILRDPESGATLYMRTQRDYTYKPDGAATRVLEIEVNDSPQGLLAVTGATASLVAEGVSISYTLSRDAQVTAQVRNLAGRVIAQPIIAKPMSAGTNLTLWDARDQAGLAVPAGKYLITITARSEDGQETSALTVVNVRR